MQNEAFNKFMEPIIEKTRELGERPEILNPVRMSQMMSAYNSLLEVVNGSGVEITYEIHEPSVNSGSISLIGANINIINTKEFINAVEKSDNFDVYTRTDKTVCIDFMFYDLTVLV